MTFDLMLNASCGGCRTTLDLYSNSCKHMTLYLSCGRNMAQNHAKCFKCCQTITRLIQLFVNEGFSRTARLSNGLPGQRFTCYRFIDCVNSSHYFCYNAWRFLTAIPGNHGELDC